MWNIPTITNDDEDTCPVCGTEWKVTTFGKQVWKDCLKCEDTRENLIAKKSSTSKEDDDTTYPWKDLVFSAPSGGTYYSGTTIVDFDCSDDDTF